MEYKETLVVFNVYFPPQKESLRYGGVIKSVEGHIRYVGYILKMAAVTTETPPSFIFTSVIDRSLERLHGYTTLHERRRLIATILTG